MKKIQLTTKEELNIYMNPTRQKLLHVLSLSDTPMTPKMLADKLSISPSSIQHHIKKLMTLDLIELDHQELINGIRASYYRVTNFSVQIGLEKTDDTMQQRQVFIQNSLANVYEGFQAKMNQQRGKIETGSLSELQKFGDIMIGILHLKKEDSEELIAMILQYLEQHSLPAPGTVPWEYAMILYQTGDEENV